MHDPVNSKTLRITRKNYLSLPVFVHDYDLLEVSHLYRSRDDNKIFVVEVHDRLGGKTYSQIPVEIIPDDSEQSRDND